MSNHHTLERRVLGRTQMHVTRLGLGGAWLGYSTDRRHQDIDQGAATVVHALELGINLIDTSPLYGRSEEIIGQGLREWYRRGGKRSDFMISSKTGTRTRPKDYSGTATLKSIEESLKALGTDYIDIMLVHDPETLDPVFAPGGALDVLRQLKTQGVIRAIGLGVRSHAFHQKCIESGLFEVSLTFGDCNLLNQSAKQDILPLAETHHVGVLNAMVVEYGLLGGRDPFQVASEHKHIDQVKVNRAHDLWAWAQTQNVDLLSLALQYASRDSRVTSILVGASSQQEIEQDVIAFSQALPPTVWDSLADRFAL